MKPLPSSNPPTPPPSEAVLPSLPTPPAAANRRAAGNSTLHRVYPWLLAASTLISGVFCFLYLTKPVAVGLSPNAPAASIISTPTLSPKPQEIPAHPENHVASPAPAPAEKPPASPALEQTNLRIQHILNVEGPSGPLAKLDLEVPVLYQSRNLRWTPVEIAAARELFARLSDYQEKSQMLRAEATNLLESWNLLIERSIPSGELRADSPTLPANQQDSAEMARPAGLNTTELIRIQPAAK